MVERAGLVLIAALVTSSCGIANGLSGGDARSPLAGVFGPPGQGEGEGEGDTGRCNGGDVVLTTDDGVDLNALWAPQGPSAVLLVHETAGDRTNWSPATFEFFTTQGYSVLSIDRRVADRDGPSAVGDIKAAHDFLRECAAQTVAFIGASTGSTPVYDYALGDDVNAGGAALTGIVFLSPGPWTDQNNAPLGDHVAALERFGGFSAIAAPEDCCGGVQIEPVPNAWSANSYTGGANFHGTQMLEGVLGLPVRNDLASFLAGVL